MIIFLGIFGVIAFLWGLGSLVECRSAIQQVAVFNLFLIAMVCFGSAGIIHSIRKLKESSIDKENNENEDEEKNSNKTKIQEEPVKK